MPSHRTNACLFACVLLAVIGSATNVLAADYFVRKTGSDSNGGTTAGTAWLTIDHAADNMSAGDTVYVGAGTYGEQVTPGQSGTSGNPIRFIADTGGSQTGDAGDVLVTGSSGLETLNVSLNKDYLEFYNFKFQGSGNDTVRFYLSDNGVLDHCEIFGGTQGINAANGNNFAVQNCIVRDNSSDGINVSYDNGMLVTGCEIYGNVSGIDVDSGGVTIRNCLIRDNSARGIDVTVGTVAVQNCTVVSNTTDGIHQGTGTLTVTNCILSSNGDDGLDYDAGTLTHTYNLIYGSGDLDYEGTSASTGEISLDPQFVSATDYRITTLSPARNAGFDLSGTVDDDFDGRVRPYDGAHDIGCYEEGPYAHWKLDETSGITAADSSGFSHDGTHSGSPTWSTTAQLGGSLDFETSDGADRVDAGNFDVVGTGLTLMAWVRQEDPLNDGRVISKSSSNDSTNDQSWGLTIDENGELDFRVTAGGTWRRVQAPGVISPNTWYHVAGTYDGTTMRLYLDGQLIASLVHTSGGAIVSDSSQTVTLGDSPIGSRTFDGLIDDARIYDRTLSVDEIVELYGGLVGHWKMDETSGTVAADSSGLGNDGTVNGTATWTSAIYGNGFDANYADGDDYVEIPNSASLENVQEESYTIAAWFKPETIPPGSGSDNDAYYGIVIKEGYHTGLYYKANGEFEVTHYLTGPTWAGTGTWGSSFAAGQYYHVASVVDRDAGTVKIYVNGTLQNTSTFTANTAAHEYGTNPWRIGIAGQPGWGTWKWAADGTVDDARIYNRALSDTEIAELYGLLGHWKLDETSGTVATDSSGLGNDGTYTNGPTLGSCGPYEKAVAFDGTDDLVELPDMNNDYSQGFSASFWVYPTAPPSGAYYDFFGTGKGSNVEDIWLGSYASDGRVQLLLADPVDGASARSLDLHTPPVLNQWQHYVFSIDVNGNGKIFLNGVEEVSGFIGQITPGVRTYNRIGSSVYNHEFPGLMDDVRLYNRALTTRQVAELHGLVGHWKLDETSGTVAADATAFSNDGTYTNGPALNQSGKVDLAAEFDGSDDYVGVPDDSTLQMGDVFSLAGWIRADSSANIDRMIINKEGEYEIAISPTNELKWGITNTDPGWSWHSTGHILTNGVWRHLALTYDHGTILTYVNGNLIDTYNGSGSVGDQYPSLNELRIGGRSNNPSGKYFDGLIDDVRIYSRILCPGEVEDLADGGVPSQIRIIKWVEVR